MLMFPRWDWHWHATDSNDSSPVTLNRDAPPLFTATSKLPFGENMVRHADAPLAMLT